MSVTAADLKNAVLKMLHNLGTFLGIIKKTKTYNFFENTIIRNKFTYIKK